MTAREISDFLTLNTITGHPWHIQACCALTGEGWVWHTLNSPFFSLSVSVFTIITSEWIILRHDRNVSWNNRRSFSSCPLQSTCQSWLDEVPDYYQLGNGCKTSSLKYQDDLKGQSEPGYFQCFGEEEHKSQEPRRRSPIQLCFSPMGRSLRSIRGSGWPINWTVKPQWSEGSEGADQFLPDQCCDITHIFAWYVWNGNVSGLFVPLTLPVSGSNFGGTGSLFSTWTLHKLWQNQNLFPYFE